MTSADLRRILHDLGHAHAQLALPVSRRLRKELGLSVALFELMAVVADRPACRVHDLAAELGVSTGGVSKLVDRLESAGLCRRLPNPSDRRSSLVELTPGGHRTWACAGLAVDEDLHRLVAGSLSAGQASELTSILQALGSAGPLGLRTGPPEQQAGQEPVE
jgi:MarR family transcriptional regulator, organic hydroperoxide resistance regulator